MACRKIDRRWGIPPAKLTVNASIYRFYAGAINRKICISALDGRDISN